MLKNLVYFGSPDFSGQILESIINSGSVNVVGVVTSSDKPQGRKQILTPSPLAVLAGKYDLPVYKPVTIDDANLAHLRLLKPDIFLVISYGKIIPLSWIETPKIGTFNVHFSLLPKYRGALCLSEAIKNQDKETGVTLMEMDEQMDHGPIIDQQRVSIEISDDVATLTTKLTQAACAQNYSKTLQDESLAVFTPSHRTVSRESAFIPFVKIIDAQRGDDAASVHALIRSLNPEPGAWTCLPAGTAKIDNLEIKLVKTSLISSSLRGGKSNSTKLFIDTVQIPGKNPISWKQFLSGHSLTYLK
ncbi:MAG: methionyl-tRNA formyltransferase, methionyl-tRNA formyltransferase [Microgenomates group bacterium GW2011_GWC1_44_10]|nr:MAG: methionyl-tRNA formyltransferase, methionyl-tRNA formyltransferase [Microgenomates group bacterium GW2011_GWC1_44_10]